MADALRWGILGTGTIAAKFAKDLLASKTGKLVAIGSRTPESAERFGNDFLAGTAINRHGSYDALLADPAVQAVYISTPHPFHAQWSIRAAMAGKHILCEKPLALNYADAMTIVEAARANGVFLMEAFMYRCHPVVDRLIALLREGVIHDVRMIHANFGFQCALNYDHRLLNNALGGGGILDVGCYPVSLARLIAGVAAGKEFLDPVHVAASGVVGEKSRVDELASLILTFSNRIIASISTGIQCTLNNDIHIYGTGGSIYIPWLWIPQPKGNKIILFADAQHQARFCGKAPFFRPSQQFQRPLIFSLGTHAKILARHGFHIMVENIRFRIQYPVQIIPMTAEVRNQHFNRSVWRRRAHARNGLRPDA